LEKRSSAREEGVVAATTLMAEAEDKSDRIKCCREAAAAASRVQ
jgi:hypothetical protein